MNATVTTLSAGSVNPEVKILGIYNGNDENGTIFGDAALTAGHPIVAVTHENVEGASALYTAITADAYDEVATLTDRYIISEFYGYWNEITNLAKPYEFFVAQWDIDQTIVSYAKDANGAEGKVARLGVKPSSEIDDIEVLRALVNERNNATPKAMCQSIVVNNSATPSMECIWNEEVGTFRGAEVIYHEVEALEMPESDLVTVKVIKSFAF